MAFGSRVLFIKPARRKRRKKLESQFEDRVYSEISNTKNSINIAVTRVYRFKNNFLNNFNGNNNLER